MPRRPHQTLSRALAGAMAPATRLARTTGLAAMVALFALQAPAPAAAGGSVSLTVVPRGESAHWLRAGLQIYALTQQHRQNNRGRVDQKGRDNAAALNQTGRGNSGLIFQRGRDHTATLSQRGRDNAFGIFQFGRGAHADVTQGGHGQTGLTFQGGW